MQVSEVFSYFQSIDPSLWMELSNSLLPQGVENGATFAGDFGLPPDTLEDPFTGSAAGGMAAYLWRYGLIDSPTFIAEQGHWMNRPGQGYVEVVGPGDDIQTVRVGGAAVTVLKGELTI